ncbi:MAG: hypothetical protein K6G02_08755, partial [Lactobacillus sp.]|nr:hypothetical protein [Lactobacillus sp.]
MKNRDLPVKQDGRLRAKRGKLGFARKTRRAVTGKKSSPNLCVKYFSQAQVVQGMRMHPCLSTITLEGAVKGAPSAHLEEVP